MLTKDEALSASEFHHGNCTRTIGKRGAIRESVNRFRRSGRTQTWKRSPERYRVPIKRGMYESADITPDRAAEWHTAETCPLLHTEGAVTGIAHVIRIQTVTVPILGRDFYRYVCTCGAHGVEHFWPGEAQTDADVHSADVMPTSVAGEA